MKHKNTFVNNKDNTKKYILINCNLYDLNEKSKVRELNIEKKALVANLTAYKDMIEMQLGYDFCESVWNKYKETHINSKESADTFNEGAMNLLVDSIKGLKNSKE